MEKIKINTIDDVFEIYENGKTDTEYDVKISNLVSSTHHSFLELQENAILKTKIISDDKLLSTVRKSIINRLHPNKIDNQYFWKTAKQKFPLFSVCGEKSIDIHDCNAKTLMFAKKCGAIQVLETIINDTPNLNLLEIGYGHGNLYLYLLNDFKKVNYIGLDYYKNDNLNEHENLKIINKSGIPNYIKNNTQDVVYSYNVLQHCSRVDRNKYFKQAYNKLKHGGFFIGGMFMETEQNTNAECWGLEDSSNTKYCAFFNQFIEVDKKEYFEKYLIELGYEIYLITQNTTNWYTFILRK